MSHYACNTCSPTNYLLPADWTNHWTSVHPLMTVPNIGQLTLVNPPAATQSGTNVTIAPTLFSQLGITNDRLKSARSSTISVNGVINLRSWLGIFPVLEAKLNGGSQFDREAFFVTLMDHCIITDATEDAFKTGVFMIYDAADPSIVRTVKWSSFLEEVIEFADKNGIKNVTGRTIYRGLAKLAFELMNTSGSGLEYHLANPPAWSRQYSDTSCWWAFSSVFNYMKSPENWSDKEKACFEAHRVSVTKVSGEDASAVRKMSVDPTGMVGSSSLRTLQTTAAISAIQSGNPGRITGMLKLMGAPTNP